MDTPSRVILITGAAGSLGRAVAQRFLQAHDCLALIDRAAGRLNDMAALPEQEARILKMENIDAGSAQDMQRVVAGVLDRFGRLDVLVNTVGGYQAGDPLHEAPADLLQRMFDLNVRTVWAPCQAVIPVMLRQQAGRIVNVSARAALAGAAKAAAYCAAKSAVMRLTESMAAELKHSGITVNCVLPGTIDTPHNRAAMPSADFSRWVSPASIAEVIHFLASDAAQDISGAAVPVFGRS